MGNILPKGAATFEGATDTGEDLTFKYPEAWELEKFAEEAAAGFDDLPSPRYATTTQLLTLAREGKAQGFNRQLPHDIAEVAKRHTNHVIVPIQWHEHINSEPAPKHVRCLVKVTTIAGAEDFTMDVQTRSLLRLRELRPARKTRGPAPKWQEVLDLLGEAVNVMDSQLGMASVGAMLQGNMSYRGSIDKGLIVESSGDEAPERFQNPAAARDMADHITDSLRRAAPVFVTAEMSDLIHVAAESLGGYQLDLRDLIADHGFAIFEESFEVPEDPESDKLAPPIRAVSWTLTTVETLTGEAVPGVVVIAYTDVIRDWDDYEARTELGDYFQPGRRWWPNLVTTWPVGQQAAQASVSNKKWEVAIDGLRHVVTALWLLANQRVTLVTSHSPGRAERRRAQRAKLPQEVRVVTLRRPAVRTEHEGEPRNVEWSHRWMVTGHWRRLWDEKENREKMTWVSPYIKGPADKPFVPKKVVYNFER